MYWRELKEKKKKKPVQKKREVELNSPFSIFLRNTIAKFWQLWSTLANHGNSSSMSEVTRKEYLTAKIGWATKPPDNHLHKSQEHIHHLTQKVFPESNIFMPRTRKFVYLIWNHTIFWLLPYQSITVKKKRVIFWWHKTEIFANEAEEFHVHTKAAQRQVTRCMPTNEGWNLHVSREEWQ